MKCDADMTGGRHHLRMHLKTTERANEEFPLEPYIQTPDKGFMTSGIEPGTLVIPVHPSQVGIPWLRGEYLGCQVTVLIDRSLQARHDSFYARFIPLDTSRDTTQSDQVPAKCDIEFCAAE